ncbi:MAG: sensor histidine kinase [Ktedonobacteraceae bacterium]|nr:sensor histidine kinase [Ktedonobacteraceae bacterium]
MRERAPQAKWTFVLHVEDRHGNPTDAAPLLQADRRLLREALDHLLENAVLYSPEGGRIDVGLRTKEADEVYLLSQKLAQTSVAHRRSVVFPSLESEYQPMVEIWIQDHGIGIAAPHLEQIFQRFYRVDTSLTREVNGLGIGLAICKQVVELHGGLLWVESEVGRGSTFHVLLPMNE